jgi:hypothetical protein
LPGPVASAVVVVALAVALLPSFHPKDEQLLDTVVVMTMPALPGTGSTAGSPAVGIRTHCVVSV